MLEGKDLIEIAELLVDHDSQDSHLGGTSIVELDGALLLLPFVGLLVPAKVKGTVAEISHELGLEAVVASGSGRVGGLHEEEGEAHLSNDLSRESIEGGESGGNVLGAGEANSGVGDEVS